MSAKYTGLACRVTFVDSEIQREHYKTEWHRYNLKRKVAQLAPLSFEDYQIIEDQHRLQVEKVEAGSDYYCECCRKPFNNEKVWDQHNKCKKHLDMLKLFETRGPLVKPVKDVLADQLETVEPVVPEATEDGNESDGDWESVSDEGEILEGDEAVDVTSCLFCPSSSKNMQDNLDHMTRFHSFFIPDAEYMSDLEGLITYLGEKVGIGLRCLWCCDKGKRFKTLHSVQQHMVVKGHCKMLLEPGESLLEFSDYYDYSASYPEGKDGPIDDEVHLNELEVNDDMELVLPSGASVGHRSLARYYKQNLRTTPLPSKPDSKKAILHNLLSQYRSLGWAGTNRSNAIQKASDIKYLSRQRFNVGFTPRQIFPTKLSNKVGQPHFRSQIDK
jgi:pre-60S factor REI1